MSLLIWTLVCLAVFRVTTSTPSPTVRKTQYNDAYLVLGDDAEQSPYSEVGVLVFKNYNNAATSTQQVCTGTVVNSGIDTTTGGPFIDVLTAAHCLYQERRGCMSCLSPVAKSTDLMFYQGMNEYKTILDAYNQRTDHGPTHTEQIGDFQTPFGSYSGLSKNEAIDDRIDAAIVRFKGTSTSGRTLPIGSDDTPIDQPVAYTLNNVVYQFKEVSDYGPPVVVSNSPLSNGLLMKEYRDIKPVACDADGLKDQANFCTPGMSGSPLLREALGGRGSEIVGVLSGANIVDLWVRIDRDRKQRLETAFTRNKQVGSAHIENYSKDNVLIGPFNVGQEPQSVIGGGQYGIVGGGMGSEDEPKTIIVIDSLAGLVFLVFILCSFGVGLGILSSSLMQRFENMNRVQVYEMEEVKV